MFGSPWRGSEPQPAARASSAKPNTRRVRPGGGAPGPKGAVTACRWRSAWRGPCGACRPCVAPLQVPRAVAGLLFAADVDAVGRVIRLGQAKTAARVGADLQEVVGVKLLTAV